MLRVRAISDAKAAVSYYEKSDGGLELEGLRKEVGGEGAKLLGITTVDFAQFENLLNGLDPFTGNQLTAKLVPDRIPGWDFTASVPKGVTVAMEAGDDRVHDALWEAGRETMRDLEAMVKSRIRRGGEMDDRLTGNLIYFALEHPDTRPAKSDQMPDPDRHLHFCVPNITYDPVEKQFKALKVKEIYELRRYFDRRFDLRLAGKLTELGYVVEQKYKPDPRGGQKYHTWDIGMPKSVTDKFSRRTAEIEKLAAELGVESSPGRDKLGATSRMHKRTDKTLKDYREYWRGRLTPAESKQIAAVIANAKSRKQALDPAKTRQRDEVRRLPRVLPLQRHRMAPAGDHRHGARHGPRQAGGRRAGGPQAGGAVQGRPGHHPRSPGPGGPPDSLCQGRQGHVQADGGSAEAC